MVSLDPLAPAPMSAWRRIAPGPFFDDRAGDGSRGWAMLTAVVDAHGLDCPDAAAPYAYGLVDTPDSWGYALAAVTPDGATLCGRCVRDPREHVTPDDVAGWTHSGEVDGPTWCDACSREWTGRED